MKKIVFLLSLLFSIFSFSQNYDYINLTKPRPDNLLSNYFSNAVPTRLLKNVRYPKSNHNIVLSFYINKLNKPYKITFNNLYNKELNGAIKKALLNYPLNKLGVEKFETQKKYSFQVVMRKNKLESIISCSSSILTHSLPISESCNDLEFYEDIDKCINSKLKSYFNKNVDSTAIIIAKKTTKNLKGKFFIDKKGKLKLKKGKGSKLFIEATNNFPDFKEPATLNGSPTNYYYTFYPLSKKTVNRGIVHKKLGYISNTTNEFAKYLAERLDSTNIKNEGLNRLNCTISLHFELDKKGNPINLRTNTRTKELENQIFSIFKEYPINKLNLGEKSVFSMYTNTILKLKEGKITIETYPTFFNEKIPIFPGCKNSKSIKEAKSCFSRGVQKHFVRKFDADLPKKLNLSKGKKRIFIGFKIGKSGDIIDIMVRAPHEEIKEEVIRVMKKLPKVKPGLQGGKLVNVKYSIPFTIIVD